MWNENSRKKSVIARNNIAKENLFKVGTNPSTKYLKKLLLSLKKNVMKKVNQE